MASLVNPDLDGKILKKRSDFLFVSRNGINYRTKTVLVQGAITSTDVRFGFTASKRVGCAVLRNRAKRRLREIARKVLPKLPFGDFVFIACKSTCFCPFKDLLHDVEAGIFHVLDKLKKQIE